MSDTATLIADMVRAGIDPDIIGRTAAALAVREPALLKDDQAERKRAADRERTAARRAECPDWEQLRLTVFVRDGWVCKYCGSDAEPLHCDHVMPFSKGGRSVLENLVTACAPCNLSKGARYGY